MMRRILPILDRWWRRYGTPVLLLGFAILILGGRVLHSYSITVTAWLIIGLATVANLIYFWPLDRMKRAYAFGYIGTFLVLTGPLDILVWGVRGAAPIPIWAMAAWNGISASLAVLAGFGAASWAMRRRED